MKKKRGMAWLLSFLLVFSLMVGPSAVQVRAEEETTEGQQGESPERTFSVDFESGSWTIGDVTVTADSKEIQSITESTPITLTNFNADTMEVRLTGADNFSTTLNVKDGTTSLKQKANEGGIPDGVLTFSVVGKSTSGGGNQGGAGSGESEENTKEITVSITDNAECLDTQRRYIRIDGKEITPGSVRVKQADTHTISLLRNFGKAIIVTINNETVNGTEDKYGAWTTYTVNDAASYTIVVTDAGNSNVTVTWTYDSSQGEDAKVSNGTVRILSATTADNQNGIGAVNEQTDQKGLVDIKPGSTVTVEIKPDYGYQFVAGALNGQTVTAGETVSQFTFTMPKTNLHLSALFTPKADKVSVNSSQITAGKIANGQNAIDSGNLQLAISDASESMVTDAAKMKEKAGDAEIQLYLTMGLSQVVNKGNESTAWENPLTDLKGSVSVTLSLPENLKNESGTFYVIREHKNSDGTTTYDRIRASHNKSDGTITFPTNKFSTYALAYDADTPDNGTAGEDTSNNGNPGGNTGNSGSGSGTGSTSSGSSSAGSGITAATAKKVSPAVVQEQTNAQGQLLVDIAASPEHARLTKEILQKYNGTDTNLMIHLGNGVGFSADLTGGVISDQVDFGAAFSEIPNFAEAFTTYYMKPAEPQKLPGTVGIHLHVGEEYAGHVAYLFTLDRTTGLYQLHSTVTVNAIGNVMLESQELTDVMILIGK